jgi:hypothetical protein
METEFDTMIMAPIVADEKLRDKRREPVQLEPNLNVAHLLHNLIRLFQ